MKNFIYILLIISTISCNNAAKYVKHSSGLEYAVLKKSDNKTTAKEGDIVELNLKYYNDEDSLIFNSKELTSSFKMKLGKNSHKGGCFEDALKMMSIGDRYKFKIIADSFYTKTQLTEIPKHIKPASKLLFDVELLRIVSKEELEREKNLLNKQLKRQEQMLLNQYIEENEIKTKPSSSGFYYIETKRGKGKLAVNGDSLSVHYIGELINGQMFDSSYDRNEMFNFVLGSSKLIAGWNEGFSRMREGGEATFIIPSKLAYGEKGYSTIIPPFASLVFKVKLIKIN